MTDYTSRTDISLGEVPWAPPWVPIDSGWDADALNVALRDQIRPGHPLHDIETLPLARRTDVPHVLVALLDAEYKLAVVEMTEHDAESANGPRVSYYVSLRSFAENRLAADREQHDASRVEDE